MSEAVVHFTDSSLDEEVLKSDKPVLVDFWASWCGPCKALGPVIEELAGNFEGKAVIGKLSTEENSETPSKYGVMAIPTVIFFKDGEEVERVVGVKSKEELSTIIEGLL